MLVKTSDLIGPALDWAVAKCEGYRDANDPTGQHDDPDEVLCAHNWMLMRGEGVSAVWLINMDYSSNWSKGGPIIEREKLYISQTDDLIASIWKTGLGGDAFGSYQQGPTPLISAMRCFVASKLGDEVDTPEELL